MTITDTAMTTHLISGLAVVGAATGTLATALIWMLLTQPTVVAAAIGEGNFRLLAAALTGAWQ